MPFYSRLFILIGPCVGIWGFLNGQELGAGAYAIYYLVFITSLELLSYLLYKLSGVKLSNFLLIKQNSQRSRIFHDGLLIFTSFLYLALLICFFYRLTYFNNSVFEETILVLSLGLAIGSLCINVAHELGHRQSGILTSISTLLLLTCCYSHYNIEHNKGHHKNVGLHHDPATARKGESVYLFWIRALFQGYIDAWKISTLEYSKSNTLLNPMIWRTLIQIALIALIYLILGNEVLILWLFSAFIGICLLCSTNYIEHYGLTRAPTDRISTAISWDSNYYLERILLFELNHHADHHIATYKTYDELVFHTEAPKLPGGYGYCLLLSMIPPLWFNTMDKKISNLKSEKL